VGPSIGGQDGLAKLAEQQGQAADDVASVALGRPVPQVGQGVEVGEAFLEGLRIKAGGQGAAAR
jgi:hypothetical protein